MGDEDVWFATFNQLSRYYEFLPNTVSEVEQPNYEDLERFVPAGTASTAQPPRPTDRYCLPAVDRNRSLSIADEQFLTW